MDWLVAGIALQDGIIVWTITGIHLVGKVPDSFPEGPGFDSR